MKKILIVDDEKEIVAFLKEYFELGGYHVLPAYSGKEAITLSRQSPDIILLDINMPDMDGIEVCKTIRDKVTCPIVFLTARVEDADKIEGLSCGGDDYVVKPFNLDVLGARVVSHLRRENRKNIQSTIKSFKEIIIDYSERMVSVNDTPINLTKKEFEIIELLSLHPGQIFDRERIYERVWGYDKEGDSSSVTEHIKRIRQKIAVFSKGSYIETVWGVGYKWQK